MEKLQDARVALVQLSKNPALYGGYVSTKLTRDEQNLLTPLFEEMQKCESECVRLLGMFTENHPDVKEAKKKSSEATREFKSVVLIFRDGLSTGVPVHDAREALRVLAEDPLRYETVSTNLSKEQQNSLSPLFCELVLKEAHLRMLLEAFTEEHPQVKAVQSEKQDIIARFRALIEGWRRNSSVVVRF